MKRASCRRASHRLAAMTCALLASPLSTPAQNPPQHESTNHAITQEVPLQQCDRLPVVTVRVASTEKSFLVDTAATSLLNTKSFPFDAASRQKQVAISSWTGTSAAEAREIVVPELTLGDQTLRNLRIAAVDLSAIARACGGRIDGILGVDLIERMGITIDLKKRVARFGAPQADPAEQTTISEMEAAMHRCSEAFNKGDSTTLAECFDRDLVLNTPLGQYRGRENAVEYISEHFFTLADRVQLSMKIHDQRAVGEVVWTAYDYAMDSREIHLAGRGMMVCHKEQDRWTILSMHETLKPSDGASKQ